MPNDTVLPQQKQPLPSIQRAMVAFYAVCLTVFKEIMVRHIMNGSTNTYSVTPEDDTRIRQIAREQFCSWDRIYGKNPKFTIDRTGRFAGGKIQFKLDTQKGMIQDAAVYGDFFSTLDASAICAALIGCPYDRNAVLAALQRHGIDGAV